MENFTRAFVDVMVCVLLGFGCLVAYQVSEYIKRMSAPVQHNQEVIERLTEPLPTICPQCQKPLNGKKCDTCDYVKPLTFSTKRVSFSRDKKRLEREPN